MKRLALAAIVLCALATVGGLAYAFLFAPIEPRAEVTFIRLEIGPDGHGHYEQRTQLSAGSVLYETETLDGAVITTCTATPVKDIPRR